jgi:hypothetical protein
MRARAGRLASLAVAGIVAFSVPAAAATGWSITPSPNPTGAQQTHLDAVSCFGTTNINCLAVGSYVTAQGAVRTLSEWWNGTSWRIVASPNRTGAIANTLVGLSCTSITSCFAVGNSQATPTSPALTLIERWNGLGWTIMPSPNAPQATGNFLHGISCLGPNGCFAVGNYKSPATAGSTLIERWNGSNWAIVPSPNKQGAAVNTLAGVSCTTGSIGVRCFAVGRWSSSTANSSYFTLTERFNGTGWAVVASPNVGGQYKSALNAVSCTSATFCMAAGVWEHSPGASLSERWNGSTWTIAPVSNPAGWTFSRLSSVSCASATNCFAVGNWRSGSGPGLTLIVHWNGAGWTVVPSPNPSGSPSSALAGLSCVVARCTAVGSYLKPVVGLPAATLAERNY